ncbi:MAG: tetratricopeptide repeat protein [Methylophilus sp.]|uniref:tetratricopeptide repeat protein n=1 Tax=Methylophilus sp. TaxID=29541 RepID=UPI003F9F294A
MRSITLFMTFAWLCMHSLPNAMAADSITKAAPPIKTVADKACADLSPEETTRLALIQQMLAEGKPHAALAHLDAVKVKSERAELLRAHALRQTGRAPQAQVIYEQLASSCVSGHAYRGLGLIASQGGNLQEALRYLKAASNTLPTEHTIRNDYGYVLMQAGQNDPALHEFLTAVELAPDYRQAAHNLVLLLYKQGDIAKAEAFSRQFGLVEDEMQQLKKMTQASNKATP